MILALASQLLVCSSAPDPSAAPGTLRWPSVGRITSAFGDREGRRHEGVDIRTRPGTPIYAAAKGRVHFSGRMRGYGSVVILHHANDMETRYAHNRKNLVSRGEWVGRGQQIAEVGETGNATAPHLHFEVRVDGTPRDPLAFLPGSAPPR